MSIVIVTNQLKNIHSGIGTEANNLINELAKEFKLLIICPEDEKMDMGKKNVEVVTVSPYRFDPTTHRWLSFAKEVSKVINLLDRNKYKLAIFIDAREGYFSTKNSIPTLGIIHDFYSARFAKISRQNIREYPDWFQRLLYFRITKKLEERVYNRLTYLVTVCDYTRHEILKDYKVSRQIKVIWAGIDFSRLGKPNEAKEENSVLFVGGNFYRKGLPELLRAIELVSKTNPDIKCYVIGEDKNSATLKNMSKHAVFLGKLDYPTTARYFNNCQVFCMPSRFESFANVYLEGLFNNMQVIASKNSGTPEIKRYFDNLYIVDPSNVNQIASMIKKSLKAHLATHQKNLHIISSQRMGEEYSLLIKKITQGRVSP